MQIYDVVIIGGGPTGVALGIELGLHHIKTLILEKHAEPLLSPRAQSLNARSMEFFMRWKLAEQLKAKRLLPPDFPIQGVWCSKLNGKTYAVSSSNEQLNDELSPQRGIRIPLWLTEETLRDRLNDLPSMTFLKQHRVVDLHVENDRVHVKAKNQFNEFLDFEALYAVGCDGANSMVRQKMGIEFEILAKPRRVINIMFESLELEKKITVEKGFLYYLLAGSRVGAMGPVDLARGLWYAQIGDESDAKTVDELNLQQILEDMTGLSFPIKIVQAHFWNMHIQLAQHFSKDNRVFLVGDSAHAFVPTGGYGLNTGLGDVVNLGWKLASVIKGNAKSDLLKTYEQERRAICLRNLTAAQNTADAMMELRKNLDPVKNPEEFSKANAELSKRHTYSLGATMGYAYFDSPLTVLQEDQPTQAMDISVYRPITAPGYFLPHSWIEKKSIYEMLSPIHWTLIISGEKEIDLIQKWKKIFEEHAISLEILFLPENTYSSRYILIRPDWHIVFAGNELNFDLSGWLRRLII